MYSNLREYIDRLEREGELIRIAAPVSTRFEIAELTDRVVVLGNAALTGAAMLLLCDHLRPTCADFARQARLVELATNPVFMSEYVERMMF